VPHFSVSIAAQDEQGLAAGAIFDPMRGELFLAGRGRGATLNGEPLRTSPVAALAGALLATGFPYDVWTTAELPVALLDAFVRRAQGLRRMGSAALDLAYVACGRYDGYFEVRLKPWDLAAGALLVTEAGGRATNLEGGALALDQGDVLASNGPLHDRMVEIAKAVRARHARPS
jgi:myo-inositol-1(or 4)-monophosphatase